MKFKNLIYSITCLLFSIIIGAAIYEHIAVVPQWSAAPPKSLAMFQGDFGLNPEPFWKTIHPTTLLFFVLTLITSRKTARKLNVLIAFAGYFIILAITAFYFVPELLSITTSTYSDQISAELTQRAKNWEVLSLIRLGLLVVLSIILMLGLTEPDVRRKNV